MYEVSLYNSTGAQFDFGVFKDASCAQEYASTVAGEYQAQIVNVLTGHTVIYAVRNGELEITQTYYLQ